ncbi:MAG: hypothetical protein ACUZ9M_04070 [Candidatus Scalindua sp.]
MKFKKETIDKLISNSFAIDCSDICLTQKTDKSPLKFKGPGTIYQDKHGILQLKSYSNTSGPEKVFSHSIKHNPPGKFLSDDNYFTLKAIDMSGYEWHSDNICLSINMSLRPSSQVIQSELEKIETTIQDDTRTNTEENDFAIISPGKYTIPCNEITNLPNEERRKNRAVFSANKINFELRKLDNYLIIEANAKPENLEKETYIKLLQALSIVTGHIIRPVVIENTQKGIVTLEIKSVDDSFANKEAPFPFKHSTPTDFISFTYFIEKYLVNIDTPFSDLYGFWHKINRAWQAGIENTSLSLGVAIEGIIKTYFSAQGLPDVEITKQAVEAKQLLKLNCMDLGQRIIQRLLNSIDGLLKNTSPKGALLKMVKDGLLNKDMPSAWDKLRNKSAHPDKTNQDRSAVQENIDRFYTCIALFHLLLFDIIEYEGSYIDYSKSDWPERKFLLTK